MTETNALANKLAGIAKERAAGEKLPPIPVPAELAGQLSYEERTKRATFHVDIALLNEMNAACTRAGMSKAQFIKTAIERHLEDLR